VLELIDLEGFDVGDEPQVCGGVVLPVAIGRVTSRPSARRVVISAISMSSISSYSSSSFFVVEVVDDSSVIAGPPSVQKMLAAGARSGCVRRRGPRREYGEVPWWAPSVGSGGG
jgi:hypothetical protein